LQAQPIIDLDIWVDTSTYGGVGVLVAGLWATWKLVCGLSSMAQDISWEVVVTINLAVVWLVQKGQHDTCLMVHCDNMSVMGPSGRDALEILLIMTASPIFLHPLSLQTCFWNPHTSIPHTKRKFLFPEVM